MHSPTDQSHDARDCAHVSQAALEAIQNSAENDDCRIKFVSAGVTPGLLRFVVEAERQDSLETELIALTALLRLSMHPKNHNRMVRDQALASLYAVVQVCAQIQAHTVACMCAYIYNVI